MALLKKLTKSRGKKINGWTYPPLDIGRAGQNSDFVTRAALQSLAGICAHDPVEAVYLNISEHDDQPLSGKNNYVLTFPKGGFPPYDETKHGFWSVTMYNASYNLVGPTNYTINSNYPEYKERDSSGGMTIVIQNADPGDLPKGSYWLKSPPPPINRKHKPPANRKDKSPTDEDDNFFLVMRVYVPEPSVSATQTWEPPKIRRN